VPDDRSPDQKAYFEAALALRGRAIQGKGRMRKRLAALNFSEKVKILEKLRDRSLALAASGLKPKPSNSGGRHEAKKE